MGQSLEIRTSLRPEAMAPVLTREIKALDANLAPSEISSPCAGTEVDTG